MKLSNYTPSGHDLLVKIEQTNKTPSGIIMPNPRTDRVVEIVGVGALAKEQFKIGQFVLVGPAGDVFPMVDDNGNTIAVSQIMAQQVMGTYDKSPDETEVYMTDQHGNPVIEDSNEPSNILDNPGLNKSTFLNQPLAEA